MFVKVNYLGFYPLGSDIEINNIKIMQLDWNEYKKPVLIYGKKNVINPFYSKLFYVKMWDKQNRLIYLGSAAKAYNTRTKATEACWVSTYYVNGRIYTSNEFAHYCQRAQSYTPFGTGNL